MHATALGHRLETLHDGLTTFANGEPVPVPLVGTEIAVSILSGLAVVRTQRSFLNGEGKPIEAVMTFPVGFDAVVTGLAATIDGRRMVGIAKPKEEARETYEAALDEGRLTVLHEEALRGIHILSVGALPPGAEVVVELEQTVPLSDAGGLPFLRLPMTAGQVYGTSPLLPTDDLVTSASVRHAATLTVMVDRGRAVLAGRTLAPGERAEILLDHAIEIMVEGGTFGTLHGVAADGRQVSVALEPAAASDGALDVHVIVDRSGSTNSPVQDRSMSLWEAMRAGLAAEFETLRPKDRLTLWQFESTCQRLGAAFGPDCAGLVSKLEGPAGGTELAAAVKAAVRDGANDILVLTDGQTWAHLVEELKEAGNRISAILVGPGSLDANIGHLCALTGGQVLYAPGRDVASALRSAFAALRIKGAPVEGIHSAAGPKLVTARRGGITITASWADGQAEGKAADAIGRFAAALALPLLSSDEAEAMARAHSLCTHMTSLVLVDEAGEATAGFSQMRKVPLMASEPMRRSMHAREIRDDCVMFVAPRPQSPGRPSPEALAKLQSFRLGGASEWQSSISRNRRSRPQPTPSLKESPDTSVVRQFLNRLRGVVSANKAALFEGFPWDLYGDALMGGDLTGLSGEQREVVEQLAQRVASAFAASNDAVEEIGDPRVLALGLIARLCKDRLAGRFARRALRHAPPWLLVVS